MRDRKRLKENSDEHQDKSRDENLAYQKVNLREHYKVVAAKAFSDNAIAHNIGKQLIEILPDGATIAAFVAQPDEPSLQDALLQSSLKVAFPKLAGDELEFFTVDSTVDLTVDFLKNKFGILEPHPMKSQSVQSSDLFAVIVPGLAFDRKGMRLGRGKGYYDRALAKFNGLKIGVCSCIQISEGELPAGDFDIAMDIVVCEKFILKRFDT